MKKLVEWVKIIIFSIIILGLMFYGFFGAVLQTSYRLCPVTAQEIAE